jgi:hypothetical protein
MLRGVSNGGIVTAQLHAHIGCEVAHTRSMLTPRYKYLYAPQRRSTASADYGASGRHPAVKSHEQLYDVTVDPSEAQELISFHGLVQVRRRAQDGT